MKDMNEVGIDLNRVQNGSEINLANVTCVLCQKIVWKPVSCRVCEKMFCSICLLRWFWGREDEDVLAINMCRWFHEQRYDGRENMERWFPRHTIRCPMGCESFIEGQHLPDVDNLLSNLRITCVYAPNNCPEVNLSIKKNIFTFIRCRFTHTIHWKHTNNTVVTNLKNV